MSTVETRGYGDPSIASIRPSRLSISLFVLVFGEKSVFGRLALKEDGGSLQSHLVDKRGNNTGELELKHWHVNEDEG